MITDWRLVKCVWLTERVSIIFLWPQLHSHPRRTSIIFCCQLMKIADTPLVARARENIKPARPTLTLNRKIMKYFSEIFYWMQSKAPAPQTPSARLFSMTAFGNSFVKGINHLKTPLTNFTVLKIIYSSFLQCMMSNKSPVQPRRGESRNSLVWSSLKTAVTKARAIKQVWRLVTPAKVSTEMGY